MAEPAPGRTAEDTEDTESPDETGPAADDGPRATVTALPGAGDGFDRFFLATTPEMVRVATLIVGSRAVAEDLVQDAFVRVHARWASIDDPAAYTRRAVVNACRSHLRRRVLERRHRASLAPGVAELEARELLDALGCAPGTVGSLVHRALATLRQAIDR